MSHSGTDDDEDEEDKKLRLAAENSAEIVSIEEWDGF
jgi:hypothetical protein